MFTAKQRLERAIVSILRDGKWRYLSGVILMGKHEICPVTPTAYTDGRNAKYGEKFIEGLNDRQMRGLVLHEVFHVLYKQLMVWQHLYKENPMLTNAACDFVINLQILAQGEVLPDGALVDKAFTGMDVKQVYDILKKDPQRAGVSLDVHGWDEADKLSPEEKEELSKALEQALRQGALASSMAGENVPREISQWLTPSVDWRRALRDFVSASRKGRESSTWARPHRRFLHSGVYLPTQMQESVGSLVVAVDTSGSINGPELNEFASEVQGIVDDLRPESMDVLYWGTTVVAHEHYDESNMGTFSKNTKPKQGGGTDVRRVFDYVKNKIDDPDCIVVLTDGVTPWPQEIPRNVLFVMNTDIVAPAGKTVKMSKRQGGI